MHDKQAASKPQARSKQAASSKQVSSKWTCVIYDMVL
jgi:hypothetical protein